MILAILTFLIVLMLWTIYSLEFFLKNMGNKYRQSRWYDKIILAPALFAVFIISKF